MNATKRIIEMTANNFAAMSTTELTELSAEMDNYVLKATTPDGRPYVAAVRASRELVRAELGNR